MCADKGFVGSMSDDVSPREAISIAVPPDYIADAIPDLSRPTDLLPELLAPLLPSSLAEPAREGMWTVFADLAAKAGQETPPPPTAALSLPGRVRSAGG